MKPVPKWVVIALFAAAFAVRLIRINEVPQDFWTLRQYHNALMARSMFYQDNPAIPEPQRSVGLAFHKWLAEPPILEATAAAAYRLIGSEQFWVVRLITVSAWVIGGFFLYLTACRLLPQPAAVVAAAYFLFLPYGVVASRSWQPDLPLTGGLLASLFTTLWYFERPSGRRLAVAIAVAAAALLFKPGPAVFTMGGVFAALTIHRDGWRKVWNSRPLWAFALLMVLPSALVNAWAAAANLYSPGEQLFSYLSPRLYTTVYFWRGWLGLLLKVLTPIGLVLAAIGFFLFPPGRGRALLWGCVAGYVTQSFLCTFTTPTHDYWHLQAVIIASLCLGALSIPVWNRLNAGLRAVAGLVAAAGIAFSVARAPWVTKSVQPVQDYIRMCREIGDLVGHTRNAVLLDYDFSSSLRYFAVVGGTYWPTSEELEVARVLGKPTAVGGHELTARERFERYYARLNPDYFIVCRVLRELDSQPGLRDFLYSSYPVLAKGNQYVILDLRQRKGMP